MNFLTKTIKYVFAGNAAIILTIVFLPIFLITDQIDLLNSWLDFLWKED